MARRSRSQSSSPNRVLVIFLVLFILLSIGGFVWAYTLKKEQDKFDTAARAKTEELSKLNQTKDWYQYQRDELLAALGAPQFIGNPEAVKTWKDNRNSFTKGEGKYQGEEFVDEFRGIVKSLQDSLGGYSDGYRHKLSERQKQLESELAELREKFSAETLKLAAKTQDFAAIEKKNNESRDVLQKSIQAGNDKILAARKEMSQAMTDAIRNNDDLQKKLKDREEEFIKLQALRDTDIRSFKQAQVKAQEFIGKDPSRPPGSEVHSLLLDISTGKPLWDAPRAKIVRVEDGGKKLIISKGSKDGVKPGLTFNVFSTNTSGQAQGTMKATVEVVRVDNSDTSTCKVSTFYDNYGREISAIEATPGELYRDGGLALREGDLLFNTLWGAHVAVAGIVSWNSGDLGTPVGQMESLKEFIRHLERQGVVVDAFVDPRDGSLVGGITAKTNFLIRGGNASVLQDGVDEKRAKTVNDNIKILRDQAIDTGLFILSVENFSILTGYRRPASTGVSSTIGYIPIPPGGLPRDPDALKKDQK